MTTPSASLRAAAACLGAALVTPSGGASPDVPSTPTVVLVTVDTLRLDRATSARIMPWLAGETRRGVSFRNVHSQVPLTLPSHATIMTGVSVQRHGVRDNLGHVLPRDLPTIAESFAAAGRRTGAFIGGYPLTRPYGLDRGFLTFDDRLTAEPLGVETGQLERPAGEVVDAALAWLRSEPARPAFVWVHLYDPHDPYAAPPPYAGRHAHPYDDEAAYVDAELGRLVAGVRAQFSSRPVWCVIVSDHGEALGAKGERTHGIFLYEDVLRVPLVILGPRAAEGRVVETPASLLDVAPTIATLAGVAVPRGAEGRSLDGWIRAAHVPSDDVRSALYLESIHARRRYGWAPLEGVIADGRKYVAAPRPELYDLKRDPGETSNLWDPSEDRTWRARLNAARGERRSDRAPVPDADRDRLAALGYAGGSDRPADEEALHDRPRPDPKDRIPSIVPLERGLALVRAGRLDDARRAFDDAIALDPENVVALNNLGIIALRQNRLDAAVGLFRRGLRADPFAEKLANDLGLALARLGKHEDAVAVYRRALDIAPTFTGARFNLAIALHRLGRSTEALRELDRVGRDDPSFPDLESTRRAIAAAPATRRPE